MAFDGDGPRISVMFDADVDGTVLPLGWLRDTDNADATGAFIDQPASNVARWDVTATWNSGDTWEVAFPAAPLLFPQSGLVS